MYYIHIVLVSTVDLLAWRQYQEPDTKHLDKKRSKRSANQVKQAVKQVVDLEITQ